MSQPHELTLESFARNLYNDDAQKFDWRETWVDCSMEQRRVYRKQAWFLYVENVEQSRIGVYKAQAVDRFRNERT